MADLEAGLQMVVLIPIFIWAALKLRSYRANIKMVFDTDSLMKVLVIWSLLSSALCILLAVPTVMFVQKHP